MKVGHRAALDRQMKYASSEKMKHGLRGHLKEESQDHFSSLLKIFLHANILMTSKADFNFDCVVFFS